MQAGRVVSDMRGFASIFNITSAGALMIGNRLDKMTTSLVAQTGGTRREVNALQESMTTLAATTAGSLDTVTQITAALGESGQTIGENADVLVRLVDTWGLSAHSATQLKKSADVLNLSFKGLLNTTVGYQKAFKLSGMVAQLPAAMNFATKSVTQFSRSVVHDEKQVIETTMKTGAVISRAFGKPFSEGLQMAQQHFSTFSDALENTRNVFLGIDDGFGAMQTTLFEAGLSLDEVTEKLRQGQKDPIEYAKGLNQIYERLKATASPWYAERFLANAKKSSSEVVRLYLSDGKKLAAADEARAMANQLAGGDWEKMTEAMRANADTAITGFHDMLGLAKEVVSLGFADIITEIFGGKEGVTKTFQDLNTWIITVKTTFMKGDLYEKGFKPVLVGLGKLVVYLTTASGILGPLAFGFGAVLNVVKFLASPLELLMKGGDAAVGAFGSLADMLGNAALSIAGFSMAIPGLNFVLVPLFGLLGVGLKGAGLGLSGFSAVGLKNFAIITAGFAALGKFVKGTWAPTLDGAIKDVEGSFSGIGKFLDESLGGIPTQLMNYFLPQDEEKLIKKHKKLGVELYRGSKTKALWFINDKGEWERAGLTLQERFKNLGQKVKGYLEQWKKDKTLVPAMNSLFTDMGDSIDLALNGGPTKIMNALFGAEGEEEKTFGQRMGAVGEAIGKGIEILKDEKQRAAWFKKNIKDPISNWITESSKPGGLFSEWSANLAAGMGFTWDLIKGLFPDDKKDSIMKMVADLGKQIGSAIMVGIGSAFTEEAFISAAPTFSKYVTANTLFMSGDLEGAKRVVRMANAVEETHRVTREHEELLARKAERDAETGRTIRSRPITMPNLSEDQTTKADARRAAVVAETLKTAQELQAKESMLGGFFGTTAEADAIGKLAVKVADMYKETQASGGAGVAVAEKGQQFVNLLKELQPQASGIGWQRATISGVRGSAKPGESRHTEAMHLESRLETTGFPVIGKLNSILMSTSAQLKSDMMAETKLANALPPGSAEMAALDAHVGQLREAIAIIDNYSGSHNYGFLDPKNMEAVQTAIQTAYGSSAAERARQSILRLKSIGSKQLARNSTATLNESGLLTPFQDAAAKPAPPPAEVKPTPGQSAPASPAAPAATPKGDANARGGHGAASPRGREEIRVETNVIFSNASEAIENAASTTARWIGIGW
jgi:hypothetical protein